MPASKTVKVDGKGKIKTFSSHPERSEGTNSSRQARTVKVPSAPTQKLGGLTVSVFDLTGKSVATVTLPKEIFGQIPNKNLLSQAIHIYQANSKPKNANTKTRGEIRGGGAKPWRQKGTGNARAGSKRSPLWVGGGITFGPRSRDTRLSLPVKMRRIALISALSAKTQSGDIKVIKNIESAQPKTKIIASLLSKLEVKNKTLIVVADKNNNLRLATRNIPNVSLDTPQNLNAYEILQNRNLILSQEAISKFK